MTEHLGDAVTYDVRENVAVLTFDDGKANALGHQAIDALTAGLDRARDEARAVLLAGRPGKFCAGFDLEIMTGESVEATRGLLAAGAHLALRLYTHPQPVVAAGTGHALAAGAILLMSCDKRFGADGPYKIGMSEVAIGMALPRFAIELARERLSKRHLQLATQHAEVFSPAGAIDAGYLDELSTDAAVVDTAFAYAAQVAAALDPAAFATTRGYVRADSAAAIEAGLTVDLTDFVVHA